MLSVTSKCETLCNPMQREFELCIELLLIYEFETTPLLLKLIGNLFKYLYWPPFTISTFSILTSVPSFCVP